MRIDVDEVHYWKVEASRFSDSIDTFFEMLSIEEKRQAEKFALERDRKVYIVTHGGLRHAIGKYLGCDGRKLKFDKNEFGKPFLPNVELCFNISHTADVGMLAFCRGRNVGIDVERAGKIDNVVEIAKQYYADVEYEEIVNAYPCIRDELFYRFWTMKEAVVKAIGKGLSVTLSTFKVPASAILTEPIEIRENGNRTRRLMVKTINMEFPYFSAIAVEGINYNLKFKEVSFDLTSVVSS